MLDRMVIDAVARFRESNIGMMALLTWKGLTPLPRRAAAATGRA